MTRAKGICPDCGRIISGRATGIERQAADRRFVLLAPHNRQAKAEPPVTCLPFGARRVVPRLRV
jgi:hypothetical protein